jgi:simple sugar transport system ATP-binding protein
VEAGPHGDPGPGSGGAGGRALGGERQSLAIARALHQGARVLILDEPTAALGVKQSGIVLERVARARDRGPRSFS